jgi:hypothetical protein
LVALKGCGIVVKGKISKFAHTYIPEHTVTEERPVKLGRLRVKNLKAFKFRVHTLVR